MPVANPIYKCVVNLLPGDTGKGGANILFKGRWDNVLEDSSSNPLSHICSSLSRSFF